MADLAPPQVSATLDDPFVETPPHAHPPQPLRHAAFDPDAFSSYANSSPKQARLALEAHMKETDRRIQEASKLGSKLVQQRKDLNARIKELGEKKDTDEIGPDLRKKLAELEREYTDVGRETARAVLPKSRLASSEHQDPTMSPAVFAGVSGGSPSKVAVPSRKQRNQPASRVHDIEFATEISTSLLAQVRSLQAALVEKDDALKLETSERAHLESEYTNLRSKARQLDDNEQRYKDENWNLETQIQDVTAALKLASDKEQRANQSLKTVQNEKEAMLRDLEDLKQNHGKLTEDFAAAKRAQEGDLHILRRDLAGHEHERDQLQKKIEELTNQNTELARAISYRMNVDGNGFDNDLNAGDRELTADRDFHDVSPPASPTKRAPGQGGLETETLRSSIQHAHRMIQTLKNNIHREKTEKLELKRLLQDARDELENKRGDNKANNLKNRRSMQDAAKARRARADQLGANRVSREEIIADDPEWEDHEGDSTLRSFTNVRNRQVSMPGAYLLSEESTDAFETANEKDTSTETEAFQTVNEALDDESSGDATETEGDRRGTTKADGVARRMSSFPTSLRAKRASYMSTASTSAGEDEDETHTPINAQPKYKIKNVRTRSFLREGSASANNSPALSGIYRDSPAYSQGSSNRGTPIVPGQSLGDELDGMSDEESVMSGTPSKRMTVLPATYSAASSPEKEIREPMVDSGMMTEPWEPSAKEDKSNGVLAAAAGALGGIGLGSLISNKSDDEQSEAEPPVTPKTSVFSNIMSRSTEPVRPATPEPAPASPRHFASIAGQSTEPVRPPTPEPAPVSPRHFASIAGQSTEPVQRPSSPRHFASIAGQSTEPVQPPAPEPAPASPRHFASISGQSTEPVQAEARPASPRNIGAIFSQNTRPVQIEPVPVPALNFASYGSQSTAPIEVPQPVPVPQPVHGFTSVRSMNTEPVATPVEEPISQTAYGYGPIMSMNTEPVVSEQVRTPEAKEVEQSTYFALSPIKSQAYEPWSPSENSILFPPRHSSRRPDTVLSVGADDAARHRTADKAMDVETQRDLEQENRSRAPFAEISNNAGVVPRTGADAAAPKFMVLTADEGTQTMVSSQEIDKLMRNKSAVVNGAGVGYAAANTARPLANTSSPRRSSEPGLRVDGVAGRRPGSAGSILKSQDQPPPLPNDHSEKIALATAKPVMGSMGPPLLPASAYRNHQREASIRSGTSTVNTAHKVSSMRGAARNGSVTSELRSTLSRRSSMSSFASEVDHRLNPEGAFHYPADMPAATDPRMITAITQTMIGEYLWKYTRSPLSSSTISSKRHRRFFWVHPYTRTLYWSEHDPASAGKQQLKAKSVAIEAVRVVSDGNAYPPGLYSKSLVVVTPAREIVFTAPTAQRHETWFNALSYLLLRTGPAGTDANTSAALGSGGGRGAAAAAAHSSASPVLGSSDMTEDEVAEFNPSYRTSGAAHAPHSHLQQHTGPGAGRHSQSYVSVSSYGSAVSRPHYMDVPTLTPRRTSQDAYGGTPTTARRDGARSPSVTGRIGSMMRSVGRRSSSVRRGSDNVGMTAAPAGAVAGGERSTSAEEVRRQIEEQERLDRLENVRSCCDGKHDVGTLSRKTESFRGRGARGNSHSHPHEHGSVSSRG